MGRKYRVTSRSNGTGRKTGVFTNCNAYTTVVFRTEMILALSHKSYMGISLLNKVERFVPDIG